MITLKESLEKQNLKINNSLKVDFHKEFTEPSAEVQTTEDRLKPCPFCGEEAILKRYFDSYEEIAFYVTCSGEFCEVSPITNDFKTEQEAIEAWNKRSPYDNTYKRAD